MSAMKTCPKCGSTEVESNKIYHKGDAGHAASHLFHAAHKFPVVAAVFGGMWLVGKAIDQVTEDYCCKKCRHTFS
jgi:hypothetical protein